MYVREHDLTVSISNTGRGLSREVVLEVRTLLEAGVPGRQVARQLGIGHTSVDRIRSGERHRDDQPSRRAPRAPRVGITDEMIEGMARWLVCQVSEVVAPLD